MIDIKLLRNNYSFVEKNVLNKDLNFPIKSLFDKDKELFNFKKTLDEKLFEIN